MNAQEIVAIIAALMDVISHAIPARPTLAVHLPVLDDIAKKIAQSAEVQAALPKDQ